MKHLRQTLLWLSAIAITCGLISPLGHALGLQVQEWGFALQAPQRELNFHWHGIGIVVPNPSKTNGLDRRIMVKDLGPELKDLVDDQIPNAATVEVNGNQALDFVTTSNGNLRVKIPAQHLNAFSANQVLLKVFDTNGNLIINTDIAGLYF